MQKIAVLTTESSAIQAELSGVLKDLTDMETGQRGFLFNSRRWLFATPQHLPDCRSKGSPDSLPCGPKSQTFHRVSRQSILHFRVI